MREIHVVGPDANNTNVAEDASIDRTAAPAADRPTTKRPVVPRSMETKNIFGIASQVVLSPFVLGQVVFNAISSVICSLGMFYLLFVVLVVPAGDPLPIAKWYSPNLIGVVVGSVVIVSPTLVMILAPAGLPEAVQKGWVCVVRQCDLPPWLLRCAPFLGPHPRFRRGLMRHLCLGLELSVLFIPVPLLLARYVVADRYGEMTTWTLIWFDLVFETILSAPCTIFGILSFCVEENYDRVVATMSTEPHPVRRLLRRILGCLKLLW